MLNQDLFDSLEAQKIVDTLMKGQKDYVDERLEKRETMIVSNGYAWTRPNHIDTAFASADLFEYKLQLAGQTWGYLEFETNTEKYGKVLLIIKGKKRLTNQFPLDDQIFVKKPSKVKSILDVVLSNHLVSLATIMSKQSIRLQFISEIFSVEMKFFDQYQEDRRTDRFDNIIPLYKRNNL